MTSEHAIDNTDWDKYNHQYLWLMLMSAKPKSMMDHAHELSNLAATMNQNAEEIQSQLQKLLSSWSGEAAQAAADAINPVLEWAYGSATKASTIAARLGEYAMAINTARADIPPPVDYPQLESFDHGDAADVGNATMNYFELMAMVDHKPATSAQATASKNQAVDVVRVYEQRSHTAYQGMPTFTKPPQIRGVPADAPSAEPPPTTAHNPSHPGSTDQSGTTTLSSYAGPPSGGSGVPGSSALFGSGGMPGGGPGASPLSGVGLLPNSPAAEEGQFDPLAAEQAAAEEGGWQGFAPRGQRGRSDRDGEHRDRYAARRDVVGELPPAFPPVLGL